MVMKCPYLACSGTHRNLHSHALKAPMTGTHYQVTCYGEVHTHTHTHTHNTHTHTHTTHTHTHTPHTHTRMHAHTHTHTHTHTPH